jgi:hypothetical protein
MAQALLRQYVAQLDEPSMQNLRKTLRGLQLEASMAAWQAQQASWADWGATSEDRIASGLAQVRHQPIDLAALGQKQRYIGGLKLISVYVEQVYQANKER